jgi:hypothetical protein
MIRRSFLLSVVLLFISLISHAFERVECMGRPDGSVYIFKTIPGERRGLDVRIFHGWQFSEHSLPGIPIGIEEDFLNARYRTRTAQGRQSAIAGFSPMERLIFDMSTVFHYRFTDCDLADVRVRCREESPINVGNAWIHHVEFFFDARREDDTDADEVFTIGIKGRSVADDLAFSSGRRYVRYGDYSQCLYLDRDGW